MEHRNAQITACKMAVGEQRNPIEGGRAFSGKRGQTSPLPEAPPVAAWLRLVSAVAFWLLLYLWGADSY